jgi:starch synthase
MKILMVTPELDPYVKVGGLADVAGSLSRALAASGHDVRCVCPLYRSVVRSGEWTRMPHSIGATVGGGSEWAGVWMTHLSGSTARAYFLEHERFFGRDGVYSDPGGLSYTDNDHRFIFACRAALNLCLQHEWIPDVIHCHDWTTGFVPVWLNTLDRDGPLGRCATVFTVHNLEHQGYSHRRALAYAGVPEWLFTHDNLESLGAVNMMKAGLYHSTKITTVSPTYAREIQGPGHGFGLDHVLRFRSADLIGIVNGIDTDQWNPETDSHLPAQFSASAIEGKSECKAALQRELGLDLAPGVPLIGVIARLFQQKGLDLLADILPEFLAQTPAQFAVLGTGDPHVEAAFRHHAFQFQGRAGVVIGFNNKIAHRIEGGADLFVMPSRSEPCGLTQMYAMRYGTVPVVRATGGLVDTVEPFDEATGSGTGFLFGEATQQALFDALSGACDLYSRNPAAFAKLRTNGMARDFSWNQSAARYMDVYRWSVGARLGVAVPA